MKNISRRNFLSCSAVLGGGALLASTPLLSSCAAKSGKMTPLKQPGEYYIPELPDKAVDGRELKCGLIGCGGRGTGAAFNLLEAANGVKITALGDVFQDRVNDARMRLQGDAGQEIPDEMCFVGFDAYKKVIDSGVDMVIIATPPVFRPYHFQYATEKGVHSFLEKPIAVDAAGYRTIMAVAKVAQSKGLAVVTGTQRHHQREYVEAFELVQKGMIGEITGGEVYWNQEMLWYRDRQPAWTDMEWSIRDWVNWKWLSGDHIVEQHVHNIDVFLWFAGGIHPTAAKAVGARHRRVTGDQYDCFSVDFEFENGIHLHSMCRQINGCSSSVGEVIQGTKGQWSSFDNTIRDLQGNILWQYNAEAAQAAFQQHNPYVLEHVDWVNHIRNNEAHDEATLTGISTLAGVLGREAAYNGGTLTWDEVSASQMNYLPGEPDQLAFGDLDAVKNPVIPVPGN
ncbi:MAG: Gfo/Idh/MocA family oxidoreductase [Bacteroidales bacterium]|nr:Gfo/Idh/MocA family oxidoreductase [Candidatus Equibacterium intestinale]